MSGGFFRGTSADQDTRFSNKQAKLLKSQKFAPELEHLVDMTKVKMDVMRPWIATRVTELIGFEDEVLINFIYGLLDGKEVNGKEVQISLTGFMERNTGKFMKELWSLLLSAQENASGVPQQFLDAKEEETKKNKAESDRIANEIWRKKEKESQEQEGERTKKMDRGNDILKDVDTGMQPSSKYQPRVKSAEEKESEERNGIRGQRRVSKSPHSADRSSSPRGRRSRSISKSFSKSRSYSDEMHRLRSSSVSSKQRGRFSSSEMVQRYSPRRSLTPYRRYSSRRSFSPRRRSSYSRRRPVSPSRRRSPSLTRYRMRSPLCHRSRSPLRRRSRSPIWRRPRSPAQRSSPGYRTRSPIGHRSSSIRRRLPSPARYRSPSPMRRRYRRSPSTPRRRSPSPIRRRSSSPSLSSSPIRRRSPIAGRRRSPSPANHKSPSPQVLRSPSPRRQRRSPLQSSSGRIRYHEKYSPVNHAAVSNTVERPTTALQRSNSSEHRSRSDSWDRKDSNRKVKRSSPSSHRPPVAEAERGTILIEKRREKMPRSNGLNPRRKAIENKHHGDDSSETSTDDIETKEFREAAKRKHHPSAKVPSSDQHKGAHGEGQSRDGFASENNLVQTGSELDRIESNKTDQVLQRGKRSEKIDHQKIPGQQDSQIGRDTFYSKKGMESPARERHRAVEKFNDQHHETVLKLSRKVEQNDRSASVGSDFEESDKSRAKVDDKRKKKRAGRQALGSADESSYDSYAEERKEAKRRKKEEKRLRKEERRWRRKERRRRKEERRAEKQKLKSIETVSSPSETGGNHDGCSDDDQHVQKKLEIELRERALESLRAKKGIGH